MKKLITLIFCAAVMAGIASATDVACGQGSTWKLSDQIVCDVYVFPDGHTEMQCGNYGYCETDCAETDGAMKFDGIFSDTPIQQDRKRVTGLRK